MNFSQVKQLTIPEGEVTEIICNGVTLWKAGYTNQVPVSTDTDGSIFNGVGYIENRRLSSSGGLSSSTANGAVTKGFIPWHGDTTILRLKGVEWLNYTILSGNLYLMFYDANKKSRGENDYMSAGMYKGGNYNHILTVTRDADGVETFVWNKDYGNTNAVLNWVRSASYVRVTAQGKGADMIVTINEEITV